MNQIKFDVSCFKPEFQEFIFKKLDCSDYFEFINKFQNEFSLNFSKYNCDNQNILIEDPNTCTFKNITSLYPYDTECMTTITNVDNPSVEQNVEDNIDKIISEINSEESSDSEDDEKTDVKFTHYFDNNEIYVVPSKKFVSKRLGKIIKRNNGYWIKNKNIWLFPMGSKHFVENILQSNNVIQEKDKVVVVPKTDHPKYGKSVIYDKSGNIGIWDNTLKGWIFNKKN